MRSRKQITAAVLGVALLFAAGGGGCAFSFQKSSPPAATAASGDGEPSSTADPGEEVLDDGRDDFGRPKEGPGGAAGGILVVIGYISMMVAGAILPLLVL